MFKKTIFEIIKFISKKYKIDNLNNKAKENVFLHYKKSHYLVVYFVKISIYLINVYSIIFFRRFFLKLDSKNKEKLFNQIFNLSLLKQDKLFLLFHAIITLHTDFEEKQKKLKINDTIKNHQYFENIIIGSGPSGSVTGLKLAEKKRKTLILEKGDFYKNFKLKHPGKEFLTKWEFGGLSSSLGNAQIKYASGECFGGGSEINSGLFHEPDKNFIKKLVKNYQVKNLYHKNLIENLKLLKKLVKVNSMKNQKDKVTNLMFQTSKKIGWDFERVPRFLTKNYKKSSMSNTLLKKYIRYGGKISLNSTVRDIKKINGKWSLEINKNNKIYNLNCKNLFLCAGTINTISLLKNNKLLKNKSYSSFHFHPMIKIIAKFPKKINSKKFDISSLQIKKFFPKFIIGNAASSRAQLKINSFSNNKVYEDVKLNWEKMAIFHATFSLGKGSIFTVSKNSDPIVIYKISKKENELLNFGLKKLIMFLFKAGCEYIFPVTDHNSILTNKNFNYQSINDPKKFNLSTVHLLGGCPFGEDKDKTVADSYGKVHSQKNLYINDGSLICEDLVKNPQGIIMSLAYRNISKFLKNEKNI